MTFAFWIIETDVFTFSISTMRDKILPIFFNFQINNWTIGVFLVSKLQDCKIIAETKKVNNNDLIPNFLYNFFALRIIFRLGQLMAHL